MRQTFFARAGWLGCLLLLQDADCSASNTNPIATTNSLPVMQGLGLSSPLPADLQITGSWAFDLNSNIQSHANDAGSLTEDLIIDGEVHLLSTTLKFKLSDDWQLGLQVTGNRVSAGQLDSVIDDWHDFFGLDDGDRSRQPQEQLNILYRNQNHSIQVTDSVSGLVDAQLMLSHQVIDRPSFKLSVHGQLNLPTGANRPLLGSQETDASLSVAAAGDKGSFAWHTNIGALAIGDDSLFLIPTRGSTWFSSLGLHWRASDRWRLSAQMDAHGPVLRSDIEELNQEAWLFSLAVERKFWQSGPRLQLYFSEDVSVNRAADFSLGINLKFD